MMPGGRQVSTNHFNSFHISSGSCPTNQGLEIKTSLVVADLDRNQLDYPLKYVVNTIGRSTAIGKPTTSEGHERNARASLGVITRCTILFVLQKLRIFWR